MVNQVYNGDRWAGQMCVPKANGWAGGIQFTMETGGPDKCVYPRQTDGPGVVGPVHLASGEWIIR